MSQISITELKARLSFYLREVRRGGEVQILDRGVPVATLSPLSGGGDEASEALRGRLLREGLLRPGSGNAADILATPPLDLGTSILEALQEDREDRL